MNLKVSINHIHCLKSIQLYLENCKAVVRQSNISSIQTIKTVDSNNPYLLLDSLSIFLKEELKVLCYPSNLQFIV